MAVDKITIQRIELAHPVIRKKLREDYTECNNTVLGKYTQLRFAYVFRSNELQNKLYLQVPKITNAKGGQSYHNYGLAFDIVMLYDKDKNGTFEEASWDQMRDGDLDGIPDWKEVIAFFKSKGWEWGGDFKSFKDAPHFQMTFTYHWKNLQRLRKDKAGYVIFNEDLIV